MSYLKFITSSHFFVSSRKIRRKAKWPFRNNNWHKLVGLSKKHAGRGIIGGLKIPGSDGGPIYLLLDRNGEIWFKKKKNSTPYCMGIRHLSYLHPPFKVSNSTGNIFKTGASELRPGHGKRRKLAWAVNHSSRGCLEGLPANLLSMQSSFSFCSIEIKEKHIAFFNDLGSHLQSLELEYSSIWEGQGTLGIEFTKAFKSFGCEW